MESRPHTYSVLANFFSYPDATFSRKVRADLETLRERSPDIVPLLLPLVEKAEKVSLTEMEELFTRTFDVKPLCCLDIGYVLFGEDYKRGSFMAELKREHEEAGNPIGCELPDHLPYVLNLLPRMSDPSLASELATCIVIPALKKMLQSFESENNSYRKVLQAVLQKLEIDYAQGQSASPALQEGAAL